ncbi:cyclin-dependent kinase 12 isoform X2 [Anoplophora glabripennis]|uniref:cyclin-dependent kinase 12 isoform X2 n=1 Tax=Anoplophora glabripennis TaxID=217634 RepID=UPI0008736084|nr:cyclin-dependent kinase 12 isoform X2 [Anoplophora glabripennis]
MPYYSELGLSIPSSSAYSSLFLSGPYSNHSSIIASNLAAPKSIPRQYRGVYKPHLSTITELNTPRRVSSPKLLYQGTPSSVRPIKKINTADIDVSVNRYKKFDKYDRSKPEVVEKKTPDKPPSPARSPRQSVEEKDQKPAKPNTTIRRDRPTVRLQTVHRDTLQQEIGEIRSWRDNFKPEELGVEAKRRKKSPGEILKEKFLIRSRSKENILKPESKKITRKNSVRKSPSFQEICEAITSDNLEEDLNPGQPEEVQRRQSRQISSENILKQIRRNSTDLSEEDLKILDAILSEQDAMPATDKVGKESFESRTSVRKKKVKKSDDEDERTDSSNRIKKSHSKEKVTEAEPKSPVQRRPVKKRPRTPTTENEKPDELKEDIYQNVIRDISQVEIEQTAFKPKPVISGSAEIGQTQTALKAIVDDVEVQEAAKPKREKKFRFNVIVEVEDEENYDRSSITPEEIKAKSQPKVPKVFPGKITLTDNHKGIVQHPKPKERVVSSILKKRSPVHKGKVIEEKVKKAVEESPILSDDKINSPSPTTSVVNENNFFNQILEKKENVSDSAVDALSKRNFFSRENSQKEDSRPSSPGFFSNKNKDLDNSSVPSSPLSSKKNLFSRENSNKQDSGPSSPGFFKDLDKSSAPSSPLASKNNFSRENSNKQDSRPSSPGFFSNKNKSSAPSSPFASKKNLFSRENSGKEDSRPSSPGIFSSKSNDLHNSSAPGSPFGSKSNLFNGDTCRPSSPGVLAKVKSLDNVPAPLSPLASKRNIFSRDNSKNDETSTSTPGTSKNKSLDNISAPSSPFANKINLFNRNSSKTEDAPPSSPSTLLNKSKNVDSVPTPASPLVSKSDNYNQEDTPPSFPLFKEEKSSTPPTTVLKKSKDTESKADKDEVPQTISLSQDISSQEKDISKEKDSIVSPITEIVSKEVEAMIDNLKDASKKLDEAEINKDENDNNVLIEKESPDTKEEPEVVKKLVSKRSLVQKANKDDPDLEVFVPPEPEPEPEPEPVEEKKDVFVPLQSNRLSQWMHPWKKPEQFDVCPVEIFARPKVIRGRHYPRPRGQPAPAPQESSSEEDDDDEEEEESEEETSSEDETSEDEGEENMATKVGARSLESRDSPTTNHANNPAFALDSDDIPEEYSQSSTYSSFQKSGRITPPATTIPRFRKYCLDDFNFLKVLGKGSFGKVLLAELKGTEYYYAIKCLKKDVVLEDDDVECTLIERKVLALGTKHPYLCHLLCTFQTESHLFFVMEYLNGGDLMFHIQASGRFPEHQARFYGAEIVSGLKFLHNKGIVYRDLKLDNVLLDFDGHVRIADFGMCKLQIFLDRMAETFCGTPDYMAPEIIKGLHYNQCVDWWSFGVLLYEMLLGQSPFSGCDEDELFWSICNEKPVLPRYLSTEATNILTLFLEKDASKRLGNRFSPHGDIQDQPFFRSIDWRALEARQLESPFKPNLQHPLDTQYFDKHFTVEKAKLTPIESTILQSMDQTQFQGFSYTNPNATDK